MKAIKNHKYARFSSDGKTVDKIFDIEEMPVWCECGIDNLREDGTYHPFCIATINITNYGAVEIGDQYDKDDDKFISKEIIDKRNTLKIEASTKYNDFYNNYPDLSLIKDDDQLRKYINDTKEYTNKLTEIINGDVIENEIIPDKPIINLKKMRKK